jgi:hypothetical protein
VIHWRLLVLPFALGACAEPAPAPDASAGPDLAGARATVDAWVELWNTYDLAGLPALFVGDGTLTYFSSETEGVIRGMEALRTHHEGFGFAEGGAETESRLWLEGLELEPAGTAVSGTAIWFFRSTPQADEVGRGPVTFVLVPTLDGYKIQHAHFANY